MKEDRIAKAFPKRETALHKYGAGVVTMVGGSGRYINAPVIAALGARAAGAGLLQLVVPDASRIAASALVPEATFTKLQATVVAPKADVTAVGMGLGTTPAAEMTISRLLSGSSGKFVLDADALNVLANWYATRSEKPPMSEGQVRILTPHEGEAARLLARTPQEITADRKGAALRLVERYNSVVVLKGPHTLVARPGSEEIWECAAGNPFMALGGMGDLLTGMIAARWARLVKVRPAAEPLAVAAAAASAAVWLHATAADELVNAAEPEEVTVASVARRAAVLRIKLEK